ncbi:hypothetical protein D3C76_681650 [compost metagenome]
MIFQHHLTIAAAQDAQGDRRGLDHVTVEQIAFNQGPYALHGRGDEPLFEAAYQKQHQANAEQAEQQGPQQLQPEPRENGEQVDCIDQLPI